MARIYTRTGDGGETHLGDGSRRSKADQRIDLYGDIDELNSFIGVCVATLRRVGVEGFGNLPSDLQEIQSRLFDLGSILANPSDSELWAAKDATDQDFGATELEGLIDAMDRNLPALKTFILPGGQEGAASLHVARSVCRRVERKAVAAATEMSIPLGAVIFFNRLSDFLFTAARTTNVAAGVADIPWVGRSGDS
ncbi:MAG: cob(I)alamin adenosyltransferase [Candidatus Krumholzibacteriia bacterium]|jgi:cob(I)alamin adenosyltransferase